MKIVETIDVLALGRIPELADWITACENVRSAVEVTDWPHGSGKFRLNPGTVRHANGVMPIKFSCMQKLKALRWRLEQLPRELAGVPMGDLDAMLETAEGPIGFEWETGNISSSHRAINKI